MRVLLFLLLLASPGAFAASPGKAHRAEKEMAKSLAAIQGNDPAGALRHVSKAISLDPRNAEAHALRAAILIAAAETGADPSLAADMSRLARADLTIIIQLDPASDMARQAAAELAKMRGTTLFAEPEAVCSPESQAELDTAEELVSRHDYVAAEAAYARATSACPTNVKWWTWYGDLYLARQEYARAGEQYRKALAIAPCYWSAHRFLADAQARGGDLAGSYHSLAAAVACNPAYEDAWNDLASLAAGNGSALFRPAFAVPDDEDTGDEADLQRRVGAIYQMSLDASKGETVLDRRRDAVRNGLAFIGAKRLAETYKSAGMRTWQLLARAQDAGYLDEAILIALVDAELAPELSRHQQAHQDRLVAFVEKFLAPVSLP